MNTFSDFARQLIENNLQYIVGIIVIVARFVGIAFIIAGLVRLYRASNQNMMYRVSPIATLMMFIVGTVFVAYTPYLTAFSNSLFGSEGVASISSEYLNYQGGDCAPIVVTQNGSNYADNNPFCPMMAYANNIPQSMGDDSDDYTAIAETVTYALLFVVGLVAFLRGLALLVKVGDGGQSGTLPKAVTHIIAGLVGVNAPAVYGLLQGIYGGLVPST